MRRNADAIGVLVGVLVASFLHDDQALSWQIGDAAL
jgi:hypothetical protein